MRFNYNKYVKWAKIIETDTLVLESGKKQKIVFEEVDVTGHGFNRIILVRFPKNKKEVLAYAGFFLKSIGIPLPNAIELRMLKVDPKYYGKSIGSLLLIQSILFSKRLKKKLVLEPRKPREEYPLSTEQLKEFYEKHGFREFTTAEKKKIVRDAVLVNVDKRFKYHGFDPKKYPLQERTKIAKREVFGKIPIKRYAKNIRKDLDGYMIFSGKVPPKTF